MYCMFRHETIIDCHRSGKNVTTVLIYIYIIYLHLHSPIINNMVINDTSFRAIF